MLLKRVSQYKAKGNLTRILMNFFSYLKDSPAVIHQGLVLSISKSSDFLHIVSDSYNFIHNEFNFQTQNMEYAV